MTAPFKKRFLAASLWLIVAILLQAGLKIWILIRNVVPFNSDEAVVALMARHILQGERPIFFYGQAYMGSADAYLVATGFWIFGEQVWVIRLVQCLLYLGTILTTWWILAKRAGNLRAAVATGLLLAVPAVNLTLYTTASLGGYGEALLLGNFIIIVGLNLGKRLIEGDAIDCKSRILVDHFRTWFFNWAGFMDQWVDIGLCSSSAAVCILQGSENSSIP